MTETLPVDSKQVIGVSDRAIGESKVWEGSTYYDDAEKWTWLFWDAEQPFLPLFEQLDLEYSLELACGHGRHSEFVINNFSKTIDKLILMDVLESNIEFCKSRIDGPHHNKCSFIKNDGCDFTIVEDTSLTSIFCYDAMVHFHRDVVREYLDATFRVLKTGGRALFHHSNYNIDPDDSFSVHPHARAFMSSVLFEKYVKQSGLRVIGQRIFDWGGISNLDCLTLVEKFRP